MKIFRRSMMGKLVPELHAVDAKAMPTSASTGRLRRMMVMMSVTPLCNGSMSMVSSPR